MFNLSAKSIKALSEYIPLVAFFISYWGFGLQTATAVLVGLTIVAVIASRILIGRIPLMPLITAIVVTVFGGLTLLFDDERFIKMKPTIVQVFLALALVISAKIHRPLLKTMMGNSFIMSMEHWQKLSYRFALFFIAMAGLNEYIWRQYSTDVWINFKFFGLTGLTLAFSISQVMYLMRHGEEVSKS